MRKGAKRYDVVAAELFDDPEVQGDLLLLALGILEMSNRPEKGTLTRLAEITGMDIRHIKAVINRDVPKFRPLEPKRYTCGVPLTRYPRPCGRNATLTSPIYDPETGTFVTERACSRHRDLLWDASIASRQAWMKNGSPTPPANSGGLLMKHFQGDWDMLYSWASNVELRGVKPRYPAPPQLRVLPGGIV
jgi:hypothetical protein